MLFNNLAQSFRALLVSGMWCNTPKLYPKSCELALIEQSSVVSLRNLIRLVDF